MSEAETNPASRLVDEAQPSGRNVPFVFLAELWITRLEVKP